MRHSKIFKREDGSKVELTASLFVDHIGQEARWSFTVAIQPPRKRTWFGVFDTNDWNYRKLAMSERRDFEINKYLNYVSPAEILEVQTELWEKIKPTKIS